MRRLGDRHRCVVHRVVFFGAAVFVFGQAEFGTIRTLLGFAGLFLVVALLAAIGLIVARTAVQSRIAQIAASAAAPWWLNARLLAAGLDFGKTLGGPTIAIGLVGAFLVGLWLGRSAGTFFDTQDYSSDYRMTED